VISYVEARIQILHWNQLAAASRIQNAQNLSCQGTLPKIDVNLPNVIEGFENVMMAAHVSWNVVSGKLAVTVEKILVLSVAASQLHTAPESRDGQWTDNESLVRMHKELECLPGVIRDDRERMRGIWVVGNKTVIQQSAQTSNIIANGLDVGYPEPTFFVACLGGFSGTKQGVQHQGSRVCLVHCVRVGILAQTNDVRKFRTTLTQKIGDQGDPFLVCHHVYLWGNGLLGSLGGRLRLWFQIFHSLYVWRQFMRLYQR
jgi:hypothetical protein